MLLIELLLTVGLYFTIVGHSYCHAVMLFMNISDLDFVTQFEHIILHLKLNLMRVSISNDL